MEEQPMYDSRPLRLQPDIYILIAAAFMHLSKNVEQIKIHQPSFALFPVSKSCTVLQSVQYLQLLAASH